MKKLKKIAKLSRKYGFDLGLKFYSNREISTKCNLRTTPGQHGNKKKKIGSNYFVQLSAKQSLKNMYGMLEKQFKIFYMRSKKKKGVTGEILLKMLESRLDNLVFKMGFSSTLYEARQLVSHKFIIVKNKKYERYINIPSYIVPIGTEIMIKKNKNTNKIKYSLQCAEKKGFVKWVNTDINNMKSIYLRYPERNELSENIKENLVVEFYSR